MGCVLAFATCIRGRASSPIFPPICFKSSYSLRVEVIMTFCNTVWKVQQMIDASIPQSPSTSIKLKCHLPLTTLRLDGHSSTLVLCAAFEAIRAPTSLVRAYQKQEEYYSNHHTLPLATPPLVSFRSYSPLSSFSTELYTLCVLGSKKARRVLHSLFVAQLRARRRRIADFGVRSRATRGFNQLGNGFRLGLELNDFARPL